MPGPVSDSYDPEWGTAALGDEIREAVKQVYRKLSRILGEPPIYILDLVRSKTLTRKIEATLTEREWRLLRFACERAEESL